MNGCDLKKQLNRRHIGWRLCLAAKHGDWENELNKGAPYLIQEQIREKIV